MRRIKKILGLLLTFALTFSCLTFEVLADSDVLANENFPGQYNYTLYKDGLLKVTPEINTIDLDMLPVEYLEKATSVYVDFTNFGKAECKISCASEMCNISSFEFLFDLNFSGNSIEISGFPKFTGAENSVVYQKEAKGTLLEISKSFITSVDFLKGLNLSRIGLSDCAFLESVVASGDYENFSVSNCDNLTKIDLRGCTKLVMVHSYGNDNLTELYYPNTPTFTTLSYNASANNPKLTEFEIPASVTTIDTNAIYNSGIKSLKIPEGVKNIKHSAFYDTNNLKTIYLPYSLKTLSIGAFSKCKLETVIYSGTQEQFEKIELADIGDSTDVSIYDAFGEAEIRFEPIIGWVKTGNDWIYYIEPGVKVAGWQEIDDAWFFFDSKGVMQTGWLKYGGSWYYFDPGTGAMVKGWKQVNGNWYFFDNNSGAMYSNVALVEIDKVYVLNSSGTLANGWCKIGQSWYYCGSDGVAIEGWKKIDGIWYFFFRQHGAMASNCWVKDNGKWYFLDESGKMVTGWKQSGEYWYYFKSSGEMAANEYCKGYWLDADGKWSYEYVAKWNKNSTGWWYGDTAGWYAKNCSLTIDGKVYNFNASGYCTNP